MAQVRSKQLYNPISGSFTGSFTGDGTGLYNLNTSRILTGSIIASVSMDPDNLFLIKSGSDSYLNIKSNGDTTIYSDLFIIKNFTTHQPILTVSQSIIQFVTQSLEPTGNIQAGSIWFTSSSFYIGLE